MIGRGHFWIHCRDFAVRADEDRDTGRSWRVRFGGAVSDGHRFVRVAQQVIRKVELFLKRAIILGAVHTTAEYHRILTLEILDSITEPVAFDCSTGGIGFRIPPDQNVFTQKTVERNRVARLVRDAEGRGLITNVNHG